jgi:hypothetical protein
VSHTAGDPYLDPTSGVCAGRPADSASIRDLGNSDHPLNVRRVSFRLVPKGRLAPIADFAQTAAVSGGGGSYGVQIVLICWVTARRSQLSKK